MPAARRFATLVAFVHCLEASEQDKVLEVVETDKVGKDWQRTMS